MSRKHKIAVSAIISGAICVVLSLLLDISFNRTPYLIVVFGAAFFSINIILDFVETFATKRKKLRGRTYERVRSA